MMMILYEEETTPSKTKHIGRKRGDHNTDDTMLSTTSLLTQKQQQSKRLFVETSTTTTTTTTTPTNVSKSTSSSSSSIGRGRGRGGRISAKNNKGAAAAATFLLKFVTGLLRRRRLIVSFILLYVVMLVLSLIQNNIIIQYYDTNNNPLPSPPIISSVDNNIIDQRLFEFKNGLLEEGKEEFVGVGNNPNNNNNNNKTKTKTLALLYPIGMIGGYRNQVIRYISFIKYAIDHNIKQILLPSVVWTTTHIQANDLKRFFPIPMDILFDINYWNTFATNTNNNNNNNHKGLLLPIFVNKIDNSDCWGLHNPMEYRLPNHRKEYNNNKNNNKYYYISPLSQQVLDENALLTPTVNYSRLILSGEYQIKPRQFNLYPLVENCTNPIVYGGGKGGGKLWNDYVSMEKLGIRQRISQEAIRNSKIIELIQQALLPSKQWRDVAKQCVLQHRRREPPPSASTSSSSSSTTTSISHTATTKVVHNNNYYNYVALHARVEIDMMKHKCGKYMEKNLTKILNMVDDLIGRYNIDKSYENQMHGIFLAVSRQGMKSSSPVVNNNVTDDDVLQNMADYNWDVLMSRSLTTTTETHSKKKKKSDGGGGVDIFECGELWTDRWYDEQATKQRQNKQQDIIIEYDHYGSILPSIINFHIAVHASIFIGVQGSSWSTDVWNTRYHQGKGSGNYEYTVGCIQPLPDDGLPPPHQNCKEIKFKNCSTI